LAIAQLKKIGIKMRGSRPYYKSKLNWSRTWAKFCQLIANLFVILLKLEVFKSDFQGKEERYKHRQTCN